MANKSPENSRLLKAKSSLDYKFMELCKSLNITIEEEEDTNDEEEEM